MAEHKRIYRDSYGLRRTMIWNDQSPGDVTIHTQQALDEIVDGIARDAETFRNDGVNRHVARLPAIVVEDLIQRGIYFDHDAFDRWLNSSEASPWRIWRGQV